jgi:hypothetical protein
MFHLDLERIAIRAQTLRSFKAVDPWEGGRERREWTLNLYRIVAANEALSGEPIVVPVLPPPERIIDDPRKVLLSADEALGIETDGWHRLIPRVLARLWARGAVGDLALPPLIHALEPKLRRRDFLRPVARNGLWVIVAVLGALALPILAAGLVLEPPLVLVVRFLGEIFAVLAVLLAAICIVLEIAVRWRDRRIETQFHAARVRLGV